MRGVSAAKTRSTLSGYLSLILTVLLFAAGSVSAKINPQEPLQPKPNAATYVGNQVCKSCHEKEYQDWLKSHHSKAMAHASEQSVLGDFNNAKFEYAGTTSTFFKKNNKFFVNTDGPDGELHDYEILFTFGFDPLQQYLIELEKGRYQALSIAWDARSKKDGGQRWYHLYPDDEATYKHPLHWTKQSQNWNFVCAECHSTNLKRNFDPKTRQYHTSWSDINVACEACHGPGSEHIKQISNPNRKPNDPLGLIVQFNERKGVEWVMDAIKGTALRSKPNTQHTELNVCGRCHSRRTPLAEGADITPHMLDHYRLQLLTAGYYHPDGQPTDETYVYGSFLQSKMFHAGVTCSECHDAHTMQLKGEGNTVCLQCHSSEKFNTPKHHFHPIASKGALCAECHMAPQNYMGVDARHDHSFRIPRPDLSVKLGTPNACNNCHDDKSAQWAANQVREWYGDQRIAGYQNYAETFYNARLGHPAGGEQLVKLIENEATPDIAKATAIQELQRYPAVRPVDWWQQLPEKHSDLVCMAIAYTTASLAPETRTALIPSLLEHPTKAVRMEAAKNAARIPASDLPAGSRTQAKKVLQEYVRSLKANRDTPEAYVNLGLFHQQQGDAEAAHKAYVQALKIAPYFAGAWLNLADLYRAMGRDNDAEKPLQEAMAQLPENADLHHAMGLLKIRRKQYMPALLSLRNAARLAPDNTRYNYVYALALAELNQQKKGMEAMERALRRNPINEQLLMGMVEFKQASGDIDGALIHVQKLMELAPEDPRFQKLHQQLKTQQKKTEPSAPEQT